MKWRPTGKSHWRIRQPRQRAFQFAWRCVESANSNHYKPAHHKHGGRDEDCCFRRGHYPTVTHGAPSIVRRRAVNFAKLGLAGVSASHSNFIAKVQARAARLKRKEPPPLRSKGGGILAQRPMYKFLVQPMPTVVTTPNLSAHKPAGDRASRYKDPRQMPSRRPRLEPVQSQYPAVDHCEAEGSHRDSLGSIAATPRFS